ncbi:MAG: type II toxin-antitoxin system VapC family toxin [Candidatus Micrarchaeota archaeon]|nr:type II toxin-antitoxin system VapC family toxin [Candidatus Micrarchaeota archaeon]MDE1848174.1 type II toxin-antitoxin system VapC family toxin [Candidatus Micrarchaeota archaeon]MDE1864655.1 type II toxin-antitoxin system VapC family toxin [Candidatus Micrarchaeota archaeon]
MQYVDSNVFIYAVVAYDKTVRKARLAKEILIRIAEGKISAATASLTWDEVVWSIRRELGSGIATEEGKRFLEFPNLKILSIDETVVSRAQRLVEMDHLKPRDAIHVACCVENNIREIISDDTDLDASNEVKRIGLDKA